MCPAAERGGRLGLGRCTTVASADSRGRYVRTRPTRGVAGLAPDTVLWAGAVYQCEHRLRATGRGDPRGELTVLIGPGDWFHRARMRQTDSLVVLCVDAPGFMGACNRMVVSEGTILSLLLDAYVKRDQVSLVSFRGAGT